jgi:hypothetical protein
MKIKWLSHTRSGLKKENNFSARLSPFPKGVFIHSTSQPNTTHEIFPLAPNGPLASGVHTRLGNGANHRSARQQAL